jgi:hypothetical protein
MLQCHSKPITSVFFFVAHLFFSFTGHAQEFLWAKGDTEYNNDEYKGLVVDSDGNSYVTGSKNFAMTLRKYNPAGELLWSQQQSYQTRGHAIALDDSNNLYVTGYFVYEVTFGDSVDLTGEGEEDIFLARFDKEGELLWVKQAGGAAETNENDRGNAIAVDDESNVYVAGSYEGPASFDTMTINGNGKMDLFVAKYDAAGNIIWLRHAGNTETDVANGMMLDDEGNLYVTGQFRFSISFDTITLTGNGNNADIFLVKYDPFGNVLWARNFGNTSTDVGTAICTGPDGNLFMTGYGGAINFDGIQLPSVGGTNVFIWKGDKEGNTLWAKSAASISSDYGYAIATDATGNCFVTGKYGILESGALSMTFDSITINSVGGDDIFIAKYDGAGNIQWAFTAGSTWRYDQGSAIATDGNGNCIAAGLFWGGLGTYDGIFGPVVIEGTGNYDAFICKIGEVFTSPPDDMGTGAKLTLFPNPVLAGQSSDVYLDISDVIPGMPFFLTLVDHSGRMKEIHPFTIGPKEMVSINLPPGIYIYCIHSETKIFGTGKLVVE